MATYNYEYRNGQHCVTKNGQVVASFPSKNAAVGHKNQLNQQEAIDMEQAWRNNNS